MQETITLADGTLVQVADFEFGFTLDGKAEVTQATEGGPLVIEGYASDFDVDRQDEAFEPNAFDDGLKSYMNSGNPILLYHHKMDEAMGNVKEARLDTKGLWVKAEVPQPEPNTEAADRFRKIKAGVIKGFSVGGKFYRRMTDKGLRIFKCDLREISITPMPVNPRMLFSVAGKAFDNMDTLTTDTDLIDDDLVARFNKLTEKFDSIEEGRKASGHPDGYKIAALQYHLQAVHTLAMDTKQDAESDDTKAVAKNIADNVKEHLAKVHTIAKKHGPLPNIYGNSNI